MNPNMLDRLDNVLASYETCMEKLSSLQNENEELKVKIQLLESQRGRVATLNEENSELREKMEKYEELTALCTCETLREENERLEKELENVIQERDTRKEEVEAATANLASSKDSVLLSVIVFQELMRFLNMVGIILAWDMIICKNR